MSMELREDRRWAAECDECGYRSPMQAHDQDKAFEWARNGGWHLPFKGKDLCAACRVKEPTP